MRITRSHPDSSVTPPLMTTVMSTVLSTATPAETVARVRAVVEAVEDPELAGVTIGDLGMVTDIRIETDGPPSGTVSAAEPDRSNASETLRVVVDLAPTFLGCVAVGLISLDIESQVLARTPAVSTCVVNVVHSTWSTDRISPTGVARLNELGIVVVRPGESLSMAPCPYCTHRSLLPQGGAGPTRCRTVAWCGNCRTVVEAMQPKGARVADAKVETMTASPGRATSSDPASSYAHI